MNIEINGRIRVLNYTPDHSVFKLRSRLMDIIEECISEKGYLAVAAGHKNNGVIHVEMKIQVDTEFLSEEEKSFYGIPPRGDDIHFGGWGDKSIGEDENKE